eukprot:COSAG01_NODE_8972_length_2598_cov_1.786315_2_plen_330_part_00
MTVPVLPCRPAAVYLVTNAAKYKHFERWATANDFPIENIVNDGTTTGAAALGTLGCLDLVLRSKRLLAPEGASGASDGVMVVPVDKVFYPDSVNFWGVAQFFRKRGKDLVACYDPAGGYEGPIHVGLSSPPPPSPRSRAMAAHAGQTLLTIDLEQNVAVYSPSAAAAAAAAAPSQAPHSPSSRTADPVCPAMFCFRAETLPKIVTYLASHPDAAQCTLELFAAWLITQAATAAGAAADGAGAREGGGGGGDDSLARARRHAGARAVRAQGGAGDAAALPAHAGPVRGALAHRLAPLRGAARPPLHRAHVRSIRCPAPPPPNPPGLLALH